jgi:hypothetical protein
MGLCLRCRAEPAESLAAGSVVPLIAGITYLVSIRIARQNVVGGMSGQRRLRNGQTRVRHRIGQRSDRR